MLERIGLGLLLLSAVALGIAVVAGAVAAFPHGLIGLIAIAGLSVLFVKVVADRAANAEDDYYARNVHQ